VTRHLEIGHRGRELSGVVREQESWYDAACRTAATVRGEPVPVDLAADPMRWQVDHDVTVTIRAMSRGDLPDVVGWRQAEHVHRWWTDDGDPTPEAVEQQYGPRIDGMSATRMWVVEANGRSIGFVQDYRISDYPEYAILTPRPDTIGIDYAIGEPAWVGRGFGARAVWAWMLNARHRFPDATTYFAAPDHRNTASLRILQKVGFVPGLWFDEPRTDGGVDTVVGCSLDVATVLG
jgi:aminoglycoside 6'-N-acetyltransferase